MFCTLLVCRPISSFHSPEIWKAPNLSTNWNNNQNRFAHKKTFPNVRPHCCFLWRRRRRIRPEFINHGIESSQLWKAALNPQVDYKWRVMYTCTNVCRRTPVSITTMLCAPVWRVWQIAQLNCHASHECVSKATFPVCLGAMRQPASLIPSGNWDQFPRITLDSPPESGNSTWINLSSTPAAPYHISCLIFIFMEDNSNNNNTSVLLWFPWSTRIHIWSGDICAHTGRNRVHSTSNIELRHQRPKHWFGFTIRGPTF